METVVVTPTNFWGRWQKWYKAFKQNIGEQAPTEGDNYCPVFWAAILTFLAEGGWITRARLVRYGHLIVIALYLLIGMPTYTFGIHTDWWARGLFMLGWCMGTAYLFDWLRRNDFLEIFVDSETTLEKVYVVAMIAFLFATPIFGAFIVALAIAAALITWIDRRLEDSLGVKKHTFAISFTVVWGPIIIYATYGVVKMFQEDLVLLGVQDLGLLAVFVVGVFLALAAILYVLYLFVRLFLYLNRKTGFGAGIKNYALEWYKNRCPNWREAR